MLGDSYGLKYAIGNHFLPNLVTWKFPPTSQCLPIIQLNQEGWSYHVTHKACNCIFSNCCFFVPLRNRLAVWLLLHIWAHKRLVSLWLRESMPFIAPALCSWPLMAVASPPVVWPPNLWTITKTLFHFCHLRTTPTIFFINELVNSLLMDLQYSVAKKNFLRLL